MTLCDKNHNKNTAFYKRVCEYKCLPSDLNEFLKIINKMSFYSLNLSQTKKMIKNNLFTILISIIIVYLSFANASSFQGADLFNIPYLDKIVHFGLYFLLMLVITIEHRKSLSTTRILIFIGLIPVIFGSLIELLQSGLTTTRKADMLDIVSNSAGVICAIMLWILIKPYSLEKIR